MNEIKEALSQVVLGEPSKARNFTVFPLLSRQPTGAARYMVLTEAIRTGIALVKEVSEGGSVPKLSLINKVDQPLLLVDGEQLIGCKQNRIINLTILAPAHSEIAIPVSCVEQGRWRYDSAQFRDAGQTLYAGLRAKKAVQVSRNLACQGVAAAEQMEIWADLAGKADRLGSRSTTGAMSGIYERRERDLREYARAAQWRPGQVGALFAINGRFVGAELFDADSTCATYLEKIASGFALDAIDYFTPVYAVPTANDAERFLARLATVRQARFAALGLGEDVRLEDETCVGAALVLEGRVVHFCGFDLEVDIGMGFPNAGIESMAQRHVRRPFGRRVSPRPYE